MSQRTGFAVLQSLPPLKRSLQVGRFKAERALGAGRGESFTALLLQVQTNWWARGKGRMLVWENLKGRRENRKANWLTRLLARTLRLRHLMKLNKLQQEPGPSLLGRLLEFSQPQSVALRRLAPTLPSSPLSQLPLTLYPRLSLVFQDPWILPQAPLASVRLHLKMKENVS